MSDRGGAGCDPATVVVDGNNVIGAVPDGWWRDRPAAARRLLARLACYQEAAEVRVVLVLDVPQEDLPEGDHGGVQVLYPTRRPGPNAADRRIVELLDEPQRTWTGGDVEVVSSDRALSSRVAEQGARTVGARTFLARLERLGC